MSIMRKDLSDPGHTRREYQLISNAQTKNTAARQKEQSKDKIKVKRKEGKFVKGCGIFQIELHLLRLMHFLFCSPISKDDISQHSLS